MVNSWLQSYHGHVRIIAESSSWPFHGHCHGYVMVIMMAISWSCVAMEKEDTRISFLAPKKIVCYGKVRPSLHERHRPAEVRGQEHLQPGAAPALGQRRGAVRGGHPVWGEVATYWNSDPEWREHRRAAVDSPFLVERRGEHGAERVLSGPALGMTLEPLKTSVGITPEPSIQLRWFQGQQELSEHMVATDVVPNGDWTHQLLVLLETSAAQRGVSSSCQVEHVSLEQPLSWHWARPSPTPTVPEAVGEVLGGLRGGLGCAGIN
uniref:Immunoglobulin C1-set domain-containing protein n=1 Tax=Zosterops lateralis melanops TaxID=1220523 RepID=A0A8D2QQE9_ZOSLA